MNQTSRRVTLLDAAIVFLIVSAIIYLVCGWIIVICMLIMGPTKLLISEEISSSLYIMYWGESVALWAFGIAWMVAGKVIPALVDDDEALRFKILG